MGFALFRFIFALLLLWLRQTVVAEAVGQIIDAINAGKSLHLFFLVGLFERIDGAVGKLARLGDWI